MLLDDSFELEYYDYSASAEPLPLNLDIELSKIWIPSNLLPNRKKPINPNENKPFTLYTLEKPEERQSFSVYNDECSLYNESQVSSGVSPRVSHHKLTNNNVDNVQFKQVLPPSGNATEWSDRLNIGGKKEVSSLATANSNNLGDSFCDLQGTKNTITKNVLCWEKGTSHNFSVQDATCKASIEDLTRRMAEILSEDEPLKADWHQENVIEGNQVTTGSTLDSIPPSTRDSLEELYYSDEDNQFDIEEYELLTLEQGSPEKKHTCSIYTENSYAQELLSEKCASSLNALEQTKNNSNKTVSESFEETETIPVETERIAIGNVISHDKHDDLNKIETVAFAKDSEQELLNHEVKLEDPAEKVVEFPIAYKRPPLQEHVNKTKHQKEKKKSKKAKVNIPLENLFHTEEGDRFKVPLVDEFYENLVRQGKCPPRNQETNNDEFLLNFPEKKENLFWDSAQNFTQSLDIVPCSSPPKDKVKNEEKAEPELKSEVSLDTLVIDNIPLNVSKENVESFILGFGELIDLRIEQYGKFQRAILLMDFNCDVDWIIDCLNDTQPFGSFDTELIKCYRKT